MGLFVVLSNGTKENISKRLVPAAVEALDSASLLALDWKRTASLLKEEGSLGSQCLNNDPSP